MGLLGNLFLMWHLLIYNPSAFALPFRPYFPNMYQTPQNPKQSKKCPGCAAQSEPSVSNEVKEANLLLRGPWQNSAEKFSVLAFEINLSVVNICQYVKCSRQGEKRLLITQCNSQFWHWNDFK